MESFKVLVRGTHGVVNMHIIYQCVYEEFDPEQWSWSDYPYKRVINVVNMTVELELDHICRGEEWREMVTKRIRRSDGFILTYAIDDRESFHEVKRHYLRIVDVKGTKNVPIVLCGNRCDLDDQRVVSRTEGEELAKDLGVIFIEASAFANIHINTLFKTLVREIRKKGIPKEQPAKKKKVNKDRDKQCTLL